MLRSAQGDREQGCYDVSPRRLPPIHREGTRLFFWDWGCGRRGGVPVSLYCLAIPGPASFLRSWKKKWQPPNSPSPLPRHGPLQIGSGPATPQPFPLAADSVQLSPPSPARAVPQLQLLAACRPQPEVRASGPRALRGPGGRSEVRAGPSLATDPSTSFQGQSPQSEPTRKAAEGGHSPLPLAPAPAARDLTPGLNSAATSTPTQRVCWQQPG